MITSTCFFRLIDIYLVSGIHFHMKYNLIFMHPGTWPILLVQCDLWIINNLSTSQSWLLLWLHFCWFEFVSKSFTYRDFTGPIFCRKFFCFLTLVVLILSEICEIFCFLSENFWIQFHTELENTEQKYCLQKTRAFGLVIHLWKSNLYRICLWRI